jgi:hypothetical protein
MQNHIDPTREKKTEYERKSECEFVLKKCEWNVYSRDN